MKHGLTDLERVRDAIARAYAANRARLSPFSPTMVWDGTRAARLGVTVMAKAITADVTITDDEVHVKGTVPIVFSHFEDRILTALVEHLEASLAAARDSRAAS